jgi:hypothetical protein
MDGSRAADISHDGDADPDAGAAPRRPWLVRLGVEQAG